MVKRLSVLAERLNHNHPFTNDAPICHEAAAEIERKDTEIKRLREFLNKIASGDLYGPEAITEAHRLIIALKMKRPE
jgi:predicted transcriptional regulator